MSAIPLPRSRPATVCGHPLHGSAHICAFFDSERQEYDCVVPYFAEGLERGEQVVALRDRDKVDAHIDKLRASAALPVDEALRSNRLRALVCEDTYLADGVFEAERMYRMVQSTLQDAGAQGFPRVRTCGDMSWALRGLPGTDELMQYESRLNQLTDEHDCTFLCCYDVNRFSGRMIMDVLATHPVVLLGERIYENPYYERPEGFLQKLLRRGPAPLARA